MRSLELDKLAGSILDGTPVDWNDLETTVSEADHGLIQQLKAIASIRFAAGGTDRGPGTRWGHLHVLERIGQGAYGSVYRAWDPRLEREVALKLLPPDEPRTALSDSKAIDEGRLMARVRHANVVTIYGAERIDGRVGLWMEFVKGRTLEEALRGGQTFTAADVIRLGLELCRAVSAVHTAGLLHRDIKAQNVMLDDTGRLVLMDFGTGRELEATDQAIAGTPLYLAPEVLAGGSATPQSDAYSIGVVLFRLLTNSYPVSGTDLSDLRHTHASGTPVRVGRKDIPRDLRRLLARALDPDPTRRFASADDLANALARSARAPLRRRVFTTIAAAAIVTVAAGTIWNVGLRDVAMSAPPAIAVLPFRNVSADATSDDFVEGLTDEVIRNLAVIDGLETRSQTSSFYFKDRPRDLVEVGRRLHVDFVVEATVQRSANRLRVNAQLVRVADQVPIWSDKFDRTLDDVFAIQDEISRAIVNNLRLTLGRGQRRYRLSSEATDLYFRARAAVSRGGVTSGLEAERLFRQVIALAPDFAPAHAGLAYAYAAMSWRVDAQSNEQGLAGMRPASLRALELDPLLPEAHAAMGTTFARERSWGEARRSFERAIELGPTWSEVYAAYSFTTLLPLGEVATAQRLLAVAQIHDPLSFSIQREVGTAQLIGRQYEEAIRTLRPVVDADTDLGGNLLARSLFFAGRPADAIALWEGRTWRSDWELWLLPAYLAVGRSADATRLAALDRSQVAVRLARVHAAYGDKDRTFEALDRAADEVPHRTAFLLACPEMDFLKGDPRLAALRRKLNLP